MSKNKRIKDALYKHSLKQWELAELMGINEFSLSRKLRHELPKEEQERIISLIKRNAKNKIQTAAFFPDRCQTSSGAPEYETAVVIPEAEASHGAL